MDQQNNTGSSPTPPGSFRPPVSAAVRPQVVHLEAKPGGFWRGVTIIISLMLFAFVFFVGVTIGIVGMFAAKNIEPVVLEQTYRHGGGGTVAVIPVEGIIDSRLATFVRQAADHVLNDSDVRAVILRVDSPGGGVTASDQIWYEVERIKQSGRPVVASYGGVAASGGYYVSCAADYIFAEETGITGSIGVIAQVLTMEGLMDKVGIEPVTLVASGSPEKDVANNIFREWNERDQQKVLTMLDNAYDVFTRRVRDGRKAVISDPARLADVADGSIYTAEKAVKLGLVDELGYLDQAIVKAETLAGLRIGRSHVVRLTEPPTLFGGLGVQARPAASDWLNADAIRGLVNDLAAPRVMYLMH